MAASSNDPALPAAAREVLSFWFGDAPATSARGFEDKMLRWFDDDELRAEIRRRYEGLVRQAESGGLTDWEGCPAGKLALVLVLDQFMRIVYGMDDGRAFAQELRSSQTALSLVEAGVPEDWSPEEHFFCLVPLGHAENLEMQRRAAQEVEILVVRAPLHLRPILETITAQLVRFRRAIERFGRFPHRNRALGRESSPEESYFLESWKIKHPVRDYAEEVATAEALEKQLASKPPED